MPVDRSEAERGFELIRVKRNFDQQADILIEEINDYRNMNHLK
ncbi:hypothetical protein [uncultured Gimesia sp.]|tara:strand:+ start:318536 stop:318664 length:129 start_codon:yes stop_codon:yes gene_type:complete